MMYGGRRWDKETFGGRPAPQATVGGRRLTAPPVIPQRDAVPDVQTPLYAARQEGQRMRDVYSDAAASASDLTQTGGVAIPPPPGFNANLAAQGMQMPQTIPPARQRMEDAKARRDKEYKDALRAGVLPPQAPRGEMTPDMGMMPVGIDAAPVIPPKNPYRMGMDPATNPYRMGTGPMAGAGRMGQQQEIDPMMNPEYARVIALNALSGDRGVARDLATEYNRDFDRQMKLAEFERKQQVDFDKSLLAWANTEQRGNKPPAENKSIIGRPLNPKEFEPIGRIVGREISKGTVMQPDAHGNTVPVPVASLFFREEPVLNEYNQPQVDPDGNPVTQKVPTEIYKDFQAQAFYNQNRWPHMSPQQLAAVTASDMDIDLGDPRRQAESVLGRLPDEEWDAVADGLAAGMSLGDIYEQAGIMSLLMPEAQPEQPVEETPLVEKQYAPKRIVGGKRVPYERTPKMTGAELRSGSDKDTVFPELGDKHKALMQREGGKIKPFESYTFFDEGEEVSVPALSKDGNRIPETDAMKQYFEEKQKQSVPAVKQPQPKPGTFRTMMNHFGVPQRPKQEEQAPEVKQELEQGTVEEYMQNWEMPEHLRLGAKKSKTLRELVSKELSLIGKEYKDAVIELKDNFIMNAERANLGRLSTYAKKGDIVVTERGNKFRFVNAILPWEFLGTVKKRDE